MRQIQKNIDEETWTEYINLEKSKRYEEHDKYDIINETIGNLGLIDADNETLNKYKNYIINKHHREEYYKPLRLLKSNDYINKKHQEEIKNKFVQRKTACQSRHCKEINIKFF